MEPRLPEKPLSLSANVTDPKDGKCYARGQERCSQNGCQPTPGGYYIHARLYDKATGRAHQGAKPRESWDYDPLAPRPRRHRATAEPAADPGTRRRFGAGCAARWDSGGSSRATRTACGASRHSRARQVPHKSAANGGTESST